MHLCTCFRLVNLIKSQPQEERPGESLLAGAMAMGLCFISRVKETFLNALSFVITLCRAFILYTSIGGGNVNPV